MVTINIQKKDLWLMSAIMVFLIAVGYVVAYGSSNPAIMGHDAPELTGVCKSDGTSCIDYSFGTRVSIDASGNDLEPNNEVGENIVYQAQTDGFLILVSAGFWNVNVLVGNTNPPTNIIAVIYSGYSSATIPIQIGEYVKINSALSGNPDIWWQPIGTGGLVRIS